jgi:hypothetical protein
MPVFVVDRLEAVEVNEEAPDNSRRLGAGGRVRGCASSASPNNRTGSARLNRPVSGSLEAW